MTDNLEPERAPYNGSGPEDLGRTFRDVFDLIDEDIDAITDGEVDDSLTQVLAAAGYADPDDVDGQAMPPGITRRLASLDLDMLLRGLTDDVAELGHARCLLLAAEREVAMAEVRAEAARREADVQTARAEAAARAADAAREQAAQATATVDAYVDEALDRAAAIVAEARQKAAQIVAEAEQEAEKITTEAETRAASTTAPVGRSFDGVLDDIVTLLWGASELTMPHALASAGRYLRDAHAACDLDVLVAPHHGLIRDAAAAQAGPGVQRWSRLIQQLAVEWSEQLPTVAGRERPTADAPRNAFAILWDTTSRCQETVRESELRPTSGIVLGSTSYAGWTPVKPPAGLESDAARSFVIRPSRMIEHCLHDSPRPDRARRISWYQQMTLPFAMDLAIDLAVDDPAWLQAQEDGVDPTANGGRYGEEPETTLGRHVLLQVKHHTGRSEPVTLLLLYVHDPSRPRQHALRIRGGEPSDVADDPARACPDDPRMLDPGVVERR